MRRGVAAALVPVLQLALGGLWGLMVPLLQPQQSELWCEGLKCPSLQPSSASVVQMMSIAV